jgi:asparagine synthase (glutamine-hydrolysing)
MQAVDDGDWAHPAQAMMQADLQGYLPDDILTKVDRAAMAVSLETRAPFLDHRVVEFAAHLPDSVKHRAGRSKWLLRQLLYRHVPEVLVERPKQGFAVPLDQWLRGPLRDWAEDLLEPHRLQQDGLLEPGPILAAWHEHQSGRRNHQHRLWSVLMLQAWLREYP